MRCLGLSREFLPLPISRRWHDNPSPPPCLDTSITSQSAHSPSCIDSDLSPQRACKEALLLFGARIGPYSQPAWLHCTSVGAKPSN
ncbi:hypothetical protein E2562_006908 [Oryza meyeriana var. granulata]|uniref:Uncharacterized protein n=1 Tax=Oryza meyeriana var. granulata TaxID=110450 RepID=A0A6G1BJV2_9ORYZ|nr:hypothetical protein E2562_006908 [Oryza meyeriana var. granulata]